MISSLSGARGYPSTIYVRIKQKGWEKECFSHMVPALNLSKRQIYACEFPQNNKAYINIQKKIHPDVSPETTRLSTIVNEAKEIVLKDIA